VSASLKLLTHADRDVAGALLPRLAPAPLAEAIAARETPLSTHLAEAILDHGDPALCAALGTHVRAQFPADDPVDDLWEELHDYGVPSSPPGRYERELPLIWPPRLLRRLSEALPESAGWLQRVGAARPWRAEWTDGWRLGADGATGVPAHLTLPDGVRLPWSAGVLAAAWTDLLAYPEGRALSWLDVITVVQRGVVTGEFPAAQVVHEVRPASLALSPWWWPARLTMGRLRTAGRLQHRLIEAAVDGRVAVAGVLSRLGDDPDRWAALLARQQFTGTLPELVEEAYARPVAGPAPADALLGWLSSFAPPEVVQALLDRCSDADLSGLAGRWVQREPVVRDAVVDRIAARAGLALAALVPRPLPWLEHTLLAQGDPAVTAAVYRRADPLLRAGILRGGLGGSADGDLRESLLREPTADDRNPMLASGDPDLVVRALAMTTWRAGATPALRRSAYLTVAAARGVAAIAAAVAAAGDPDPGTVEELARAVAADREDLIRRLRGERDRDTLATAQRGHLDWDAVLAAHARQPLPSLIARVLAGRTDCTPAAYRALTAGLDTGLDLPPLAGHPEVTLAHLADRPGPAFRDLLSAGGLRLEDIIQHVRPAARVLDAEGGQSEVAIRAGMLVRQGLGADTGRWLAAIRLLTDGFAGTLPELLAASEAAGNDTT
jgi:hypothetical protein